MQADALGRRRGPRHIRKYAFPECMPFERLRGRHTLRVDDFIEVSLSKMSSALLDTTVNAATDTTSEEVRQSAGNDLRQQAAERLAAHRRRRAGEGPVHHGEERAEINGRPRTSEIAAAVAERYSRSPSYRAFLAEEANHAVQQGRAAAEVAAMTARAMEA